MAVTLKQGSKGDDVKNLQSQLNSLGYSLDTDGIYGAKTAAAVKDYQSKNGLAVDGIAGVKTLGSLSTVNSTPTVTAASPTTVAKQRKSYTDYVDDYSSNYSAPEEFNSSLADYLNQYNGAYEKPEAYTSQYTSQIDSILNTILNKQDFDVNTDANYQQLYNTYKESYQNQARKGMQDAMASAQAATGGYGNSYAAAVGQQTYDDYMSQLNDQNINLMQLAYGMYQDDIANNYNQLSAVNNQDNIDYSRYRDTMNDYYTDRDYYTNLAQTRYSNDYNEYRGKVSDYQADRDYYTNLASNEYNADYNENADAYEMAMSLASNGITVPTQYASQLDADTVSQLNNLAGQAAANRYKSSSGGGSGSSKTGDGTGKVGDNSKNLDLIKTKLYNSKYETERYHLIENAVDSGQINVAEGEYLLDMFNIDENKVIQLDTRLDR